MPRTFERRRFSFAIPESTFDTGDQWCWYFCIWSLFVQGFGVTSIVVPYMRRLKINLGYLFLGMMILLVFHICLLIYINFIYKFARYRCLGRVVKSVVDIVTFSVTIALREIVEYNPAHLVLFMGFVAEAHIFARCMHVAYDVSIGEIVLALVLQPLVYFVRGDWYILLMVCMFYGAIAFYRFVTYTPPVMPVDTKKETLI